MKRMTQNGKDLPLPKEGTELQFCFLKPSRDGENIGAKCPTGVPGRTAPRGNPGFFPSGNFHRHKYPVMQCITGISMAAGTQKDLAIGAVVGAIVMAIIDLALPFAGPFIGGFIAGYLAKGDAVQAGKAGVLAGVLAAVVITIATYLNLVNSQGEGFVAGWGTGLLLYMLIGLYFVALAFLGAIIASAIRR